MVMHKILLVFSFLVFAVNGFAQTSMAGKIVDGKTVLSVMQMYNCCLCRIVLS